MHLFPSADAGEATATPLGRATPSFDNLTPQQIDALIEERAYELNCTRDDDARNELAAIGDEAALLRVLEFEGIDIDPSDVEPLALEHIAYGLVRDSQLSPIDLVAPSPEGSRRRLLAIACLIADVTYYNPEAEGIREIDAVVRARAANAPSERQLHSQLDEECGKRAHTEISRVKNVPAVQLNAHLRQVDFALRMLRDPSERAIAEAQLHASIAERFRTSARGAAEIVALHRSGGASTDAIVNISGVLSLQEADLSQPMSEIGFIVEDVLPSASVVDLIGDYSTGKSWLAIYLLVSVAFGRDFFGRATAQGHCVFSVAEGQRSIRPRIAGYLVHFGYLPAIFTWTRFAEVLRDKITIVVRTPTFSDSRTETAVGNMLEKYDSSLIVFDTAIKHMGDGQDENSSDTARAVTVMCSRLAERYDCAVVLTRHTGHADKGRIRGSSAWNQGSDVSHVIEGGREAFAQGERMVLQPGKHRDSKRPDPIHFKTAPVTFAADGVQYSSIVLVPTERPAYLPALSPKARIFEFIASNPGCNSSALRGCVTLSSQARTDLMRELIAAGAVANDGTGNKHAYLAVSGWHVTPDGKDVELTGAEFAALPVDPTAREEVRA